MDHQPGGLVDNGEVLVLVNQDEWYGARLKSSGRLVLGELYHDLLAPGKQSRRPCGLAGDTDPFVGNQAGRLGP
jgi:hypothetical protein